MSTDCFQTQFASVMESVLKTAVAETTKLFETTIEELGAEISRIKEENEDLKTKLLSLENEKKSINSSESQSREPGPSPTGSRIEHRDIGIQCALPAVRAAMADGCFGSYQYGSPSARGAEHEEDMVTELQSVTFEDGNPQMAFILIKQEEPDCDDYAPGYILLKQEGGEPTLVRRQPLRDIPALLPGAVRALVNRGTQGRPHATQPALAAAMAAFQRDPGPQVPPHTLSPARTRGATKASADPGEAPGAGEQSLAPAAQSAAPAQSLPAQAPDTQPPTPPLPQPTASSPIQPSAAAPEPPATLPTQSSPVRQRPASASLAVSPTLSERSEVTMAMLMLAHSAPRPPSAPVTTETTVTLQRSQSTEPAEPSVAPPPTSPAADPEKSIPASLQLSSFKELPSGPRSQMTKHQFLAQLAVKPLSPAQIALAGGVAGTRCGETSSQGQVPTNRNSEQTERLSSVPPTFTETVETRSVATETISVDKKEGGSSGGDKESLFSHLRFRLRPRLQPRATEPEPEPTPVSPKKPRVAKVLTVNRQSKVTQNGSRSNRSVDTPVVNDAPEGASAVAAPPRRSTGGTTRGRGTPHASPVTSPTPQRRIASTRKATPRLATPRMATPRRAISRMATPRRASLRTTTPRMTTPRTTTLRTATLRTTTPRTASPRTTTLRTTTPRTTSPRTTSPRTTSPRTTTLRTTTPRTTSPRSPSPRMTRPHSVTPSTASPRKATLRATSPSPRTTSPPEDPVRAVRTDPQQHQGPGSPRLPPHRGGETPRTAPTPHTAAPRSATAFKMSPQSPFQTSTPPFTPRRRLLKNQCAQCGRILSSATALESHVSLHTGERPFACTACARTFPDHKGLNRHARVHRTERGHECTQCGKSFVYRFGLTKHLQVVHSGIRPFSCKICSKRFVTKRDLETHYRMHTGEKPFQCSLCVKRFKRPVELNIHMRWHNGEKRHWCPHCGKGFLDYNNLKRHKLIHTGEKPHSCPQCTKHFTQSGHLKKHLKNVHKVR